MTPEQAADHVEISQVLQRYGQALDEKDYALLDRVFEPGARLNYQMGEGAPTTYPEMTKQFREFLAAFSYTQHVFSHPVIELDGDRAEARCRLIATHVQRPRAGGRNIWVVYGFYRDTLVRTVAGWRVSERTFRGVETEGELLPPEAVERFEVAPG